MSYAIDFAPHLPMALLWGFGVAALALSLYAIVTGARGAWVRLLAFVFLIAALANPLFVHETREPLPDIVALIVDHSPSMDIRGRKAEADKTAVQLHATLARDKSLEVREALVLPPHAGEDTGTQLFAALRSALADTPPDRVAGAIAITDGQVHDVPLGAPIKAPFHALIVDQKNERDRKLTVVSATRYAIVGQKADVTLRVDDFGSPPGGSAQVDIQVDGHAAGTQTVAAGSDAHLQIPITHAGENVVELSARPGPAELTLENNRAVVVVNGVRDRLRVLLISGEPNASERVWRDLLKSDPSVDLVHFTILRPPQKQAEDPTPTNELSLIVFPHARTFRAEARSFRSRDLRPLQRAWHSSARLLREHRALCRKRRRVAGFGGTGIRRPHEHLSHTSCDRVARTADRRCRDRRIQTDCHAARPRASRDARSHRRQHRRQAAQLGALVPHHRRGQGVGTNADVGPERSSASRARSCRQGARRASCCRTRSGCGHAASKAADRRPSSCANSRIG